MTEQDFEQLTLFQEGFPASHSVLPGSEEAKKMTVTSGLKCSVLCRICGPLGSLVKTLLVSSTWHSTRCYLTWKVSATPAKRLLFRLVPRTPHTGEIDVRLFPTITKFDAECGDLRGKEYNGTLHSMKLTQAVRMWPTPTAGQCGMTAITSGRPLERSTHLTTQVALAEKLIPTPIATDWKNRGCKDYRKRREFQLQTYVDGQLNPNWVEWLMAFPPGWTNIG